MCVLLCGTFRARTRFFCCRVLVVLCAGLPSPFARPTRGGGGGEGGTNAESRFSPDYHHTRISHVHICFSCFLCDHIRASSSSSNVQRRAQRSAHMRALNTLYECVGNRALRMQTNTHAQRRVNRSLPPPQGMCAETCHCHHLQPQQQQHKNAQTREQQPATCTLTHRGDETAVIPRDQRSVNVTGIRRSRACAVFLRCGAQLKI